MYKLKKVLPFIITTALSVALWTLLAMWIVTVRMASYDLMTIIVGTFVVIVFTGSTTWESIRAYHEWRKNRNEKKQKTERVDE